MALEIQKTALEGVLILVPKVFPDDRGYFMECFNQKDFEESIGRPVSFFQDNQSFSKKGVLRGLHAQKSPHEQGKLVRCVSGRIFDVAVDFRQSSPTYLKWIGTELSGENQRQLWIPEGFLHGFLALEDSVVGYKTTAPFVRDFEVSVLFSDESIAIEWPTVSSQLIVSEKDLHACRVIIDPQ